MKLSKKWKETFYQIIESLKNKIWKGSCREIDGFFLRKNKILAC